MKNPAEFSETLKKFISDRLEEVRGEREFRVDESLFLSGRLDSVTVTVIQLVVLLEQEIGVALDLNELTIARIDTFEGIFSLCGFKEGAGSCSSS